MAEDKKEEKRGYPLYLKKVNIIWLEEQEQEQSVPGGKKVSPSQIVDRMLDEAREGDTSPTKSKKNARPLEALAA